MIEMIRSHADPFVTSSEGLQQRIAAKLAQRLAMPVCHAELFVTEDCNHRCDYCFVKGKRKLRDMPEETAEAAVDFVLREASRGPQCDIMFFGGEPLLRFELLTRLVKYTREQAELRGISNKLGFSITTNGTLLTEEMAAFFQRERISYLLSVDGDSRTHDAHRKTVTGASSYDLVMERFSMMKHYQPWQGTRMTVHPDFAGQVRGNVEHLARIGINQFIIGPASGVPWSECNLLAYERSLLEAVKWVHQMRLTGEPLRLHLLEEDLESQPRSYKDQWGCGAGRGRMSVDVDGNIYPCSKIYGVNPGRTTTCLLGDVWRGITDYRKRALFLSQGEELRPKCAACELRNDCTGGCPANNLEETGSPFDPCELECAMTRMMIRLRKELAEYVRTHTEPDAKPTFLGRLKHIRPIG